HLVKHGIDFLGINNLLLCKWPLILIRIVYITTRNRSMKGLAGSIEILKDASSEETRQGDGIFNLSRDQIVPNIKWSM
uniref:Uncharacterized protein n=1 Tax=Romanomermis culicivorax TaxID=13658 RepID=A0A915KJ55_ROMCU